MLPTLNRLKCSSTFSLASSIILFILGLISLGVSIWMLSSFNWSTIFSSQTTLICTFMIIAGCLMIIGGVYGGFASHRHSNTHLSGFYGVMVLCVLLLLVCGVLAIALPIRIKIAGCGAPGYPVIAGLNATATKAKGFICDTCQCYYNLTLSGVNMSGYIINSTNIGLPTKAPACSGWNKTAYDDLLESLESSFSCAGWCPGTKGNIYLMTNVNNGIPGRTCWEATTDWFQTFSKTIGIVAFVFAAIVIVLIASVWWNLCELVDADTERVLFLTEKGHLLKKRSSPNGLARANSMEMSSMQLPGVQGMSQISQPGSPGRQVMYQGFPSSVQVTESNVMPFGMQIQGPGRIMGQPVFQQISQPVGQPIIQQFSQPMSPTIIQQIGQPVGQPIMQQMGQSIGIGQPYMQQIGQPVIQQVQQMGQPVMQQVGQPIYQPMGQQIIQPMGQPGIGLGMRGISVQSRTYGSPR